MQPSFNTKRAQRGRPTLAGLARGQRAILERLDLPEDVSRRLMELGFTPGSHIVAAMSAPGGDPRVVRVDGAEIALRSETAARLIVRESGLAPAE